MATITTGSSAKSWSPDVNTFAAGDVVGPALILQTSTIAGSVDGDDQFVRVAYVDDVDAGFVAEGAAITEDNPDLAECVVATGKVATLARISNEQFNQAGTAERLAESFGRSLARAADKAYLVQAAPTAPAVTPPTGLLNLAGVVDGGAIGDDLDVLIDGLATVEANGGHPTHWIAAPDSWAALRKLKGIENVPLLGAGTDDSARRLLGVPVLTTPTVPAGTLVAVDRSAIVSAVGQVYVAVSEHAAFSSDTVLIRATWRFGANAVRPDRIVKFQLTA